MKKKKIWILVVIAILILGIWNVVKNADQDDGGDWEDPYWPEQEPEIFDYTSFSADLTQMINSHQPEGEGEFATGRLLISSEFPLEKMGLEEAQVLTGPDDTYIVQFETPEAAEAAAQELRQSGYVEYVEPDVMDSVEEAVSWGTTTLGADYFGEMMLSAQSMVPTIAVVDSGVNHHEMLSGGLSAGWDFVDNDGEPGDQNGHGTHVAGIIADAMGPLEKVILPVRVMNAEGKGYASQVGLGIRYAADHGADVINLSLGGSHNAYKDDAIAYAQAKDCVVVVAAGNKSMDTQNYCPAHIESCLTVSAVDAGYNLAHFSNYGSAVDFCAPGVDILSADYYGGYVSKQGTSMAAPYISACVAMVRACGLAETAMQAEAVLTSSCMDLGEAGRDILYGHGLPDMTKAMDTGLYYELLDNYWIMGYFSDAEQYLYEMVFYEDGTYTAVDMRDYAPFSGSYYMSGSQLYLTMDSLELYEAQFYYEDPSFRTVEYYYWGDIRGTYMLTRSEGLCFNMPAAPEPEQTGPAASDDGLNPDWGPVTYPADGTYYIVFYVDSFRGDETRTVVTTDILSYVEIDAATANSLVPGTTLQVGGYTLNIEQVTFSEVNGTRYLDINSWEYAQYIPETGLWRFYTVNDRPLSYVSSTANLLVPTTAQVWDYLTPFAYGENIYGEILPAQYDTSSAFFLLDRVDDYYYFHMNDYSEYAYVTVQNGVVVEFTIPYHP